MKSIFDLYKYCIQTAPFGVSAALILHTINLTALRVIIPFGKITKNGEKISFQELWISGAGVFLLAYGLLSLFIVINILKQKEQSKIYISGWFFVVSVSNLFFSNFVESFFFGLAGLLCVLYFYTNKNVLVYFRKDLSD